MSLGSVLSSHGRCVTYNSNNIMMVLHSSLRREPAQKPLCGDLRYVLGTCELRTSLSDSRVTRDSLRLKIRKMKRVDRTFLYRLLMKSAR